jgi:A/G-specific adenine glycosylase
MTTVVFQKKVLDYYHQHGRDLPWRHNLSPYSIVVSELMLQQTQVNRVIPKYHEFLQRFPDTRALAQASLGDVLRIWNGLGYNRRAKYLHQAAQQITQDFNGEWPQTSNELTRLSGIGSNTAGAIMAYTSNKPITFIETNIRTVFIHHFFTDNAAVSDKEILELVSKTLPKRNVREWYWALMDYGSYLKANSGARLHQSKAYTKQSAFHGSRRQIRGQIIRLLTRQQLALKELNKQITDDRLREVLKDLQKEGLIVLKANRYNLA